MFELRRWQVRGSRVGPKRLPFLLVGEDSDECLVEEIAAEGFGGRRHALHVLCVWVSNGRAQEERKATRWAA